jgi:PAS domain S-box-containing protein
VTRQTHSTYSLLVAAVLVAASALYMAAQGNQEAHRHNDVVTVFGRLAEAETSMDRDMLMVVSGLLANYDGMVTHVSEISQACEVLLEDKTWSDPAAPTAAALTLYRANIDAKIQAAEAIKGTAAFVRNEATYLPFAVDAYAAEAPPEMVNKALSALLEIFGPRQSAPTGTIAALEAAAPTQENATLNHILVHLRIGQQQQDLLHHDITTYFAITSSQSLMAMREVYMATYAKGQGWRTAFTSLLGALSLGLFAFLARSINRQREANLQAERARSRLADAVDSLQEAFALFDATGALLLCNDRYNALLDSNVDAGHSFGRSYLGLIDGWSRLGLDVTEARGDIWSRECLLHGRRDGRWHLFRSHVTSDNGQVCLLTDLTDHRRVEEENRKLKIAVDQCPVAIVITDKTGIIEFVNPRFEELSGYVREEALGQKPNILSSGETSPEVYNELWRTISAGLTWRGDLVNRKKNGEIFVESATISPVTDSSGAITSYIALKEDVTIQRRDAELLDLTTDRLIAANEANERILFAASHDLREPVRNLVSYAQMLERRSAGSLDAESLDFLGFIKESAKQLDHLINGLGDYGRSSRPASAFTPVECSKLVDIAITECRRALDDVEVEFVVETLPVLLGDAVILLILFKNLINNAVKFRRPGVPPVVRISAEREDNGWRIDIADNGIGIEAQYLDTIIRPFSRMHSRSLYPGAGLGLASAQKIAKVHGGRLWLESQIDLGTTMHLWFPAYGDDAATTRTLTSTGEAE